MNNVSLLFYIADVVENLRSPLIFLCIVMFIAAVAPFAFALFGEQNGHLVYIRKNVKTGEVIRSDDDAIWRKELHKYGSEKEFDCSSEHVYSFDRYFPKAKWWAWLTIPVFLLILSFSVGLPTKNTIYIMATSEFAEDFINSPDGAKFTGELGSLMSDTLNLLKSKIAEQMPAKVQ